jgi:hypothetical protein
MPGDAWCCVIKTDKPAESTQHAVYRCRLPLSSKTSLSSPIQSAGA